MKNDKLQIIFSDLDGTLIHYPVIPKKHNSIIQLPPSKTGKVGVLSTKTRELCDTIRSKQIKLIYVSGMRYTTLMKRIKYLPKADVYCCDNGGRIFIQKNDGSLEEDLEWKNKIQSYLYDNDIPDYESDLPLTNRHGKLWKLANELVEQGWVIDDAGYNTCFRVNYKSQDGSKTIEMFEKLSSIVDKNKFITSSVNLGCIDFYPVVSGKKNCCDYLAKKYISIKNPLKRSCVCICDDDNDLEMALACNHAYIPSISSNSMKKVIDGNPGQFTVTCDKSEGEENVVLMVKATEDALSHILERVNASDA